jgi:hypothetical protein
LVNFLFMKNPDAALPNVELRRVTPGNVAASGKQDYDSLRVGLSAEHDLHGNNSLNPMRIVLAFRADLPVRSYISDAGDLSNDDDRSAPQTPVEVFVGELSSSLDNLFSRHAQKKLGLQ